MSDLTEKVNKTFLIQLCLFLLQDLKQIFDAIDKDKSNTLTLGEVILFLTSITDDLSEENIEKIFNDIDDSGDKIIDFIEFKVDIYSLFTFCLTLLWMGGTLHCAPPLASYTQEPLIFIDLRGPRFWYNSYFVVTM